MNLPTNIFNDFSLLKTIPESCWEQNLNANKHIQVNKYSQGEIIHFDGDCCSSIDVILNGQVVIERIDDAGNLMRITEFSPDDILGGNLLFSKNPCYPMMVTAKTEVMLLSIAKNLVFDFCATNKDFLKVYLEYISDHSLLLGDKLKHYVNRSIRKSIIAYLKSEYKVQKSQTLQLRLTKKELADRIGVQRTSLSRELQKMKNEGLVEYDKSSISILVQSTLL
ncbi:MAG: Crp/Fnr family transcriptional regulator [Dethiobacter sp.]|nr:Crp/Fnr family transcriptional regulator [Dethiobacter sp.]